MGLSKSQSRHKAKTNLGERRSSWSLHNSANVSGRLESKMASSSESTKLEHEGAFIEYPGSNKLIDKKVLVTGGEYASPYYPKNLLLGGWTYRISVQELEGQSLFWWLEKVQTSPSYICLKKMKMLSVPRIWSRKRAGNVYFSQGISENANFVLRRWKSMSNGWFQYILLQGFALQKTN